MAFSALASSPTVVITVQPIAFAILMATVPMPEPPACTSTVSPGSSLALSNSMCCTVANAIGAQAASRKRDAGRHRDHQPRRHVDEFAGEAVDVEAHDAADVLAQIVAAFAAGLAGAAGQRAVHDDRIAGLETGRAGTDRGDLAGRLDADHERHLALGEGHAAIAPEVEVVERHRLDAICTSPGAGRRGGGRSASSSLRSATSVSARMRHAGSRLITSETFWPPKPNEFDSAWRTLASRAVFGTTSSGIAGSGTL